MGLPLTWVTLSLLHMYWISEAEKKWSDTVLGRRDEDGGWEIEPNRDHTGKYTGKQNYRICGDDLIAVWDSGFIDHYENEVRGHGGKFSVGKHYRSSDYGVFTEEIFRMGYKKQKRVFRKKREIALPQLGSQQWE